VDSRQWSGKYVDELRATRPDTRVYASFGTGYAAAMRHDRETAASALATLESSVAGVTADNRAYAGILALELRALVATLNGDSVRAVEMVRAAARTDDSLPMPFGPPLTIKPPHELLGELLLAMGRHDDARHEFRLALARTPLRPAALFGLARAEHALGHGAEASAVYRQLLQLWHGADADLPELGTVRARSGGSGP
jgi:tetratricopeptide (TPR) repeat protein